MITTDRLMLGPVTDHAAPFIVSLLSDPDVRRYLGGVVPAEQRDHAVDYYLGSEAAVAHWVARLARDVSPVGVLSITPHKDGAAHELSYMFAPVFWGMGLATEAARAVVDHAFTALGHDQLIAETQAANGPSCQLLRRLGMVEDRRLMRFGAEQIICRTAPRAD